MQGLHEVAYTGGLSKPMIAPEGALGNLTADTLADFVKRNYTPSRMVLSGAGVQQVLFACSHTTSTCLHVLFIRSPACSRSRYMKPVLFIWVLLLAVKQNQNIPDKGLFHTACAEHGISVHEGSISD